MAMIHVNRGATSLGAFSEEEVREGLRTGRFALSDLGWREGMANWQTLSQFPEFAAAAATVPPPPAGATSTIAASATPAPGGGLPWDDRQERGFFNAFIETLQMVLSRPSIAFTAMKREGGLADPLIYALIGECFGLVFYFVYSMLFRSFGGLAERNNPVSHLAAMGIGWVLLLILAPIFVVIGIFVGSAILHVCLMIVGGAKQGFETT